MSLLKSAFNTVLNLQSRSMSIKELDTPKTANITAAPSNYSRNMSGPEEIVMEGREYVISKATLDAVTWGAPKRGHILVDGDFGSMRITYVKEMTAFGEIIGYRVRTD